MTGYNHVATGVIVAVIIKNPVAVIPAAFLSHFLLDALPHFGNHPKFKAWSTNFLNMLAVDAALCFAVWLFALHKWPDLRLAITLGAFFAALPDFMWMAYGNKKLPNNWFYKFSKWIQWGERPWGLIIEISYFIVALYVMIAVL